MCCNVVPLQSMFTQGGVMILQSVASGSTLCINDGEVSGKGIRDSYCKFIIVITKNHNSLLAVNLYALRNVV